MLVTHGLYSVENGVGLWAEDPDLPVRSASQSTRAARVHPFAVAAAARAASAQTVLLLPSRSSAPLDSPELVRDSPRRAARSSPELLPWRIPVSWLDPAEAVAFLIDDTDGAPRHGASVRYLTDVVAFAADLVDRGRVLPTIDLQGTGALARWRPVVQGPDLLALHRLAAAMPPVCRAEVQQPGDREGRDPHTLAAAAVDAFTDAVVRRQLGAAAQSTDQPGLDLRPPRRGRSKPTTADAWLAALTAADATIDAPDAALDELAEILAPWDEVGPAAGNARLTIRLLAPGPDQRSAGTAAPDQPEPDDTAAPDQLEPDDTAWSLEFLLQSLADPSLLVPAEDVWVGGAGLERWLERPEELLLAELGRASRIYPEMGRALHEARPSQWPLDALGAHHFLAEAAPQLDAAGIGLLLPAWWSRRHRLALRLSAGTPVEGVVDGAGGGFGRDALVAFQWQVAIGDDILTEEELRSLAAAKSPLVRVRGQWISADPDQLRRSLDFLQRKGSGRMTAGQILDIAAHHDAGTNLPAPIGNVSAEGWLGTLLSGRGGEDDAEIVTVEPSEDFRATLRPYQQRGLSYLSFMAGIGLGACLADDMGLGKTIQLLALLTREHADHPGVGPTLLICPMSVVGNWQHESATFAPVLRVYVHHGPERLTGNAFDAMREETDLVITTYAIATRDGELSAGQPWRRVVLDEAQMVKNSGSRQAVAVRRIPAAHRIALTGTPVENRLAELWSVMDFVNPGVLGTMESFRTRFAIPVERYGQREPADLLRTITRPYLLRRLKTDPKIIDDLPDKIEKKQYCPLTVEQVSLYQAVVDDMMIKIEDSDGIARRGNVLAAMAKLKQVCNHPAQFLHDGSALGHRSGKVARLLEILQEIHTSGEKVLCFTQYTEFAAMLQSLLADTFGREVLYLHGGTPKKRRDEMVARFQGNDGAAPGQSSVPGIFLLSLKAGGTGLTLTAANHVVHLDRWWNPAVENQATDRAFRIGQKRTVQVHKLICTGTLEERIDAMIEEKQALADSVVGDGEGWLTELSTGQLRELFALTAQADDE